MALKDEFLNGYTLILFFMTASGYEHWLPVKLTGRLDRTVTGHLHSGNSVEVQTPSATPDGYPMSVKVADLFIQRYDSREPHTFKLGTKTINAGPYRPATEQEILDMAKKAPHWTA